MFYTPTVPESQELIFKKMITLKQFDSAIEFVEQNPKMALERWQIEWDSEIDELDEIGGGDVEPPFQFVASIMEQSFRLTTKQAMDNMLHRSPPDILEQTQKLNVLLRLLFRHASTPTPTSTSTSTSTLPPPPPQSPPIDLAQQFLQSRKTRREMFATHLVKIQQLTKQRQQEFDDEFDETKSLTHKIFYPYDERLLPLLFMPPTVGLDDDEDLNDGRDPRPDYYNDDNDDDDDDSVEFASQNPTAVVGMMQLTILALLRGEPQHEHLRGYSFSLKPTVPPIPVEAWCRALRYIQTVNRDFELCSRFISVMEGKYLPGLEHEFLFCDFFVGWNQVEAAHIFNGCRDKFDEFFVAVSSNESYPFCNSHCSLEDWSMVQDDEDLARLQLTETHPEHNCDNVDLCFSKISEIISQASTTLEGVLGIHATVIAELNRVCPAMAEIEEKRSYDDHVEQNRLRLKRELFMSNGGERPKLGLVCNVIKGLGEACSYLSGEESWALGVTALMSIGEAIIKRVPSTWMTSRIGSYLVYAFLQAFKNFRNEADEVGVGSRKVKGTVSARAGGGKYVEISPQLKRHSDFLGLSVNRYVNSFKAESPGLWQHQHQHHQLFCGVMRLVRCFYLRGLVDVVSSIGYGDWLIYMGGEIRPSDSLLYEHELNYSADTIRLNKAEGKKDIAQRTFTDFMANMEGEENTNDGNAFISSNDLNSVYAPWYDMSLLRMIKQSSLEHSVHNHRSFNAPFKEAVWALLCVSYVANMPNDCAIYVCSFLNRNFWETEEETVCWNPECEVEGRFGEMNYDDREKERKDRKGGKRNEAAEVRCENCAFGRWCSKKCHDDDKYDHRRHCLFGGSKFQPNGTEAMLCSFIEGESGENVNAEEFWDEVKEEEEDHFFESDDNACVLAINSHFRAVYKKRGRRCWRLDEDDDDEEEGDG